MGHDLTERARALAPQLTELRHALHACPEPGNREVETSRLVESVLQEWGIETERILDTAIVGTLRGGKPGRTAALRADMDALPMQETTGAPFASRNPGWMHACGHDVHMAAALGAAMLLQQRRDDLPGTVKFLFQPDEEGSGGASRMIAAGCMNGVDAVFGAHVCPDLPEGVIGVRYGKFYAASDMFTVTVRGKSAHGATPEKGNDALAAAAKLVCRLNALHDDFPNEPYVLTVGTLRAGTAGNVLAGEAVLSGILRTLGPEMRSTLQAALRRTAATVAKDTGTAIEVTVQESYPGVVNDDGMTVLVLRTSQALFGTNRVQILEKPTMATEDFGFFLDIAPGSFYHIGTGGDLPLHNPGFLPGDSAVITAAALHASVIENYLLGDG